jgi:hypothetical protein
MREAKITVLAGLLAALSVASCGHQKNDSRVNREIAPNRSSDSGAASTGPEKDAREAIASLFEMRDIHVANSNDAIILNNLGLAYFRVAMYLDAATVDEQARVKALIGSRVPEDIQGQRQLLVSIGQHQLEVILGLAPPHAPGPLVNAGPDVLQIAEQNLRNSIVVQNGIPTNNFHGAVFNTIRKVK